MKFKKLLLIVLVLSLFAVSFRWVQQRFIKESVKENTESVLSVTDDIPWPMAGANPRRTSWTPENIPLNIDTKWVKPISPYISTHTQVIGAEGKVFVSTANGLYAFNADTGADLWVYPTDLPLGDSTYANGYLYVGGLDKKIHKIQASNGTRVWTFVADGGFVTNPIVENGKVYITGRDGALYAVNDTNPPTLAWKFQSGSSVYQSPAYKDGVLYFASNDGYGYAVNATSGALVWQSDSDPTTSAKDKFPSQGFYSWWPVIYGDDVIFQRTSFYSTAGIEVSWLFCPPGTTCTTPPNHVVPGRIKTEGTDVTTSYFRTGEKILDVSVNDRNNDGVADGESYADYFETQSSTDTRLQHGPYRRNMFFVNRSTGLERQFDIDSDGKTDAAPVSFVGDGGPHDPPIVMGNSTETDSDDVLYVHSMNRSKGSLSWGSASFAGWKVGTPYLSLTASHQEAADEPTGISASGTKLYYNHSVDRSVGAIDVSIPNSSFPNIDGNREKEYIDGGGLPFFSWAEATTRGLPSTPTGYFFKEASKYFWDPKVLSNESSLPCCPAVFWNERDTAGPSVYRGKLYVIKGNSLVALGEGGAGASAPVLSSAPKVTPSNTVSPLTDTQLKAKLEQEVSEIVATGHLKPSYLHSGLLTGHYLRGFENYLGQYWHNPAETQRVLLRALPHLSSALQTRTRAYLQSEFNYVSPATGAILSPINYSHIGFKDGAQRDPYPYPPANGLSMHRLFLIPDIAPIMGTPPENIYAVWKYAQAGIGCPMPVTNECRLSTSQSLFSQISGKLRAPITSNNTALTDAYLAAFPSVHNKYLIGYIGYIELAKQAGQTPTQYGAFETELNRLKTLKINNLKTFPDTQQNFGLCDSECYFESLITYYNFAYMTPELGNFLSTSARNSNSDKDIVAILQKYLDIAPFWMMVHNGETQGEHAIQPYQQTHSLFQALALVKRASREELVKYLDAPLVPVGDLYYIDNLVAVLEAGSGGLLPTSTPTIAASSSSPIPTPIVTPIITPTSTPTTTPTPIPTQAPVPGDANGDRRVDDIDYRIWFSNYLQAVTGVSSGDFDGNGRVDGQDYVIWLSNVTTK